MGSLKEDLEVQLGVEVAKLDKNITSFVVEDTQGNVYYAKTVIIASGKLPRHLGVPGEEELFGKGCGNFVLLVTGRCIKNKKRRCSWRW